MAPASAGMVTTVAVTRLAINYFLDSVERLTRAIGHDLDTSIVYAALSWESMGEFTMPTAGETLAEAEAQIGRRTPISVYRLARSLHMPYETTRRHIQRLTLSGLAERRGSGVVAPPLDTPHRNRLLNETLAATQAFIEGLASYGVRARVPVQSDVLLQAPRAGRLSVRFLLATLRSSLEPLGLDALSAVLYLEINRYNFTPALEEHPGDLSLQVLPDSERRPVSSYLLARQLKLPYETARRNAVKLVERGLCVRVEDGLIIPAAVVQRPEQDLARLRAAQATQDFLDDLARVGVGA
jgi:hypothetical protein